MDAVTRMHDLIDCYDTMDAGERETAFAEMERIIDGLSFEDKLSLQPQTVRLMEALLHKVRQVNDRIINKPAQAA